LPRFKYADAETRTRTSQVLVTFAVIRYAARPDPIIYLLASHTSGRVLESRHDACYLGRLLVVEGVRNHTESKPQLGGYVHSSIQNMPEALRTLLTLHLLPSQHHNPRCVQSYILAYLLPRCGLLAWRFDHRATGEAIFPGDTAYERPISACRNAACRWDDIY
jgi:hypothetical protein